MDKISAFYSSVFLIYVIQIRVFAAGCVITSASSPSGSTLNVTWSSYSGASVYLLDLRDGNSTNNPVSVVQSAPNTQALVQGLRPGHIYQVTLKVLQFYNIVCTNVTTAMTVPDTSQLTLAKAVSSTSISLQWASVLGASGYVLVVEEQTSPPRRGLIVNQTYTTLSAQVNGLTPATQYNCYVYTSNSAGLGAKSTTRTVMTLIQPPTGMTVLLTGRSTARVTWNAVNRVLLYQVTVSANDNPSIAPVVNTTLLTSMELSGLAPCTTYTVGVSSLNSFLVPGNPSNVTLNTAGITSVSTVSAAYTCASSIATVSWNSVLAPLYRATAVDGTGALSNCTSSSTTCDIANLKCGENYRVYVTAISGSCEITSNSTDSFETVPCAPSNTHTSHQCSSNAVEFSWQPTNNTFYYVASAVDNTGEVTECVTVDNTCYFTNVDCGRSYLYTVYAVSSKCNSQVSQPLTVWTAPCLPANIRTTVDCTSDLLITSWDLAEGARLYSVQAEGNTGETYNCSSNSNSCAMRDVPCGDYLSVWLTASNDNCSTDKVLGEVAQSVPCSPTNVSVLTDCSQDSANVRWTMGIGAIFYFADVEDTSGNRHTCNSLNTGCLIRGLGCGQNYTATVTSTNLLCNVTSMQVPFTTAPCPPAGIQALRDCDANQALIAWTNEQLTGLYTATLEDDSRARLNCTTHTDNKCRIMSPPCGKRFNVTVTYSDGNCLSTSTPVSMDSVPCSPKDVWANVSCATGELTVTWNDSVPALNYTSVIARGTDQPLRCNSTGPLCSTSELLCGSSYVVTVFSVTGTCLSLPSAAVTVQSLPCPPTGVTATRRCASEPVPVSWTASDGAGYYTAVAIGSRGYRSQCVTNATSCGLPELQCGDVYSIAVSGANDNCKGQLSNTITLATEPCSPINVSSQLACSVGTAEVFWSPSVNALSYTARATSNGQVLNCTGSGTNCTLRHLVCGREYDIRVSATDGTCTSNYSAPFRQDKVPCAPQNISTNLSCGTNVLAVSWIPSADPLNYSVTAVPLSGDASWVTCRTSSAGCSLDGLQCGRTYNVSVEASSGSCSGPCSSPQAVKTAPCSPQGLTAVVGCGADSLLASWAASLGATSYTTTVTGPSGFSKNCSSSDLTCSVSGLQCATQYSVAVASVDAECTGSPSLTDVTTGPCDPVNVTSILDCGSDMATVSWDASAGAVAYTAIAQDNSSVQLLYTSCSSNATSCELKQLQCGRVYNLTVLAEDATCNSTGSTTAALMTAPCSPHIQDSTLICGTNYSSVSWEPEANAISYTVNATGTSQHQLSCSSSATTCNLTDLMCSETYMASVVAHGRQCDSAPGASINITTVPCSPTFTSKQYTCGASTAVFNWTEPVGSLSFRAQVTGDGYRDSCNTTNTSCAFQHLPCSWSFSATVQAQGPHCSSIPSVSESLETLPCSPENVSASLVCLNDSAEVTWVGTPFAVGYNVTATDQDGHASYCYTNTTSCEVPYIQCGKSYSIIVTPHSTTCTGNPSSVYSLTAGLCAPSNVTVSQACAVSVVSWSIVAGAQTYIATATADGGNAQTCSSTNSSSCSFTNLQCEKTYVVTVVTVDRGCWSKPSPAVNLTTALCPPANLTGQVNCDNNTLTVTWGQSSVAGAAYMLQAKRTEGLTPPVVYVTYNTSYTLANVLCGQRYSFRVAAQDGNCNSSYSPLVEISTGALLPSSIKAITDCQAHTATISWEPIDGVVLYITELRGPTASTAGCATNYTTCRLSSLLCGEQYNVSVTAQGDAYNSTANMSKPLITAPCVPTNLSVSYNLTKAWVAWSAADGASSYDVQAVTVGGSTVTWNGTKTQCFLSGLWCSSVYNVTVTAQNLACNNSAASEPYLFTTEPCPPKNVNASIDCGRLTSAVSWEQSGLALGYVANFDINSGTFASCVATSADTSCSVSGLTCGTVYNVSVKALGQQFNSTPSTAIPVTSAPCLPNDVKVEVDCKSDGAALVSWNTTYGTANVSLSAVVGTSLQTLCATQQNSCNVTGLSCGETYNISISASNSRCSITAPRDASLTTRPCPPRRVAVDLQCGSGTAVLSWDRATDADLYVATAIAASGGAVTKCNSTGSTCQFSSLECGETYNFTVTAHNRDCCSHASSAVSVQTEPCQPVIVSVEALCQSNSVQTSWTQAGAVVNYFITVTGSLGNVTTYNTSQNLLSATLPCGQDYNVTLQAQGSKCSSLPSSPAFFTTTPCIPRNVTPYVQCELNTTSVRWEPSDGAKTYTAVATGPDGRDHQCLSNTSSCSWSHLQCGEEYTVVVKANDDNCTSPPSNTSVVYTSPCAPQNLVGSVNCNANVVSLSWDASNGTTLYTVSADAANETKRFTTNITTGNFSDLTCGARYCLRVTPHSLRCPGSSSATAFVQTWPCPPSGVSTTQDCVSGAIWAAWQASNGSDHYTATVQSDTGISQTCTSTSDTCSVSGLTCGSNFSVSVTASNQQCNTSSSQTASLVSAPCVPTNVSVVMDCASDAAVVSWSASRGALRYSVMANSSYSNNSCQTSDLNCTLNNLTCGSQYTVQVTAIGNNCSSISSKALTFNSGPCPPQSVSAQVSCSPDNMTVSWIAIREADHFLVSVLSVDGGFSTSCNTTNTSCSISNVACGTNFTALVSSVRGDCSSQQTHSPSISSAPCQPQGVRGNIDCVTNSALISWDATPGASSYTVTAADGGDYTANCTTAGNTTCEVKDLACGVYYNFSVIAMNSQCESQPSATISLQTVPCLPSNITAYPQCSNSSIFVVWEQFTRTPTMYVVTAEASDRTYLSCNSSGASCYLHGAQCDSSYTITVSPTSERCSGQRSQPYNVTMEPCPPRNVTVSASCETHSALVSWIPSPLAESYAAVAVGSDGNVSTCYTTSSSCATTTLECSQQYNIFVTASNGHCFSKASQNTTVNTGLCPPTGLTATLYCNNQSALLSWTPTANAVAYYGRAHGSSGGELHCRSTNAACVMTGLDCGTVYNFSVRASDGTCNGSFGDAVQRGAVPCPPDGLTVQLLPMQMGVQVMHFSWSQTSCVDAEHLLTLSGGVLGDSRALLDISSYWTNMTYFEIPLPCGSTYVATVKSRNAAGISGPSVTLNSTTAPCPPSAVVYTGNGTFATVSWAASVFATGYTVYDGSVAQRATLCNTSGLSCSLSGVTSTHLTITASNSAGESEAENVTNVVTLGRRRRDLAELPENAGGLSAPVLSVTHRAPTVLFVKWSNVDSASYYKLVIRKEGSGSKPQELTVPERSVTVADLSPNSIYCVSVSAGSSNTRGPESEPVCVQTGQGLSL